MPIRPFSSTPSVRWIYPIRAFAIALAIRIAAAQVGWAADAPRPNRVPITPPWALECWLWEEDVQTKDFVYELLDGYKEHDFPVRTILIDSAWSTRYNDFIVDEEHYPDPKKFFLDLQDRGYRVILWMTPNVNRRNTDTKITDASDWFDEARKKGYLAGGGYIQKWWKGEGGYIDYTNSEAMKWWRGLQADVLDWGLDGWKLDDTALYFNSAIGAAVGAKELAPKDQRTGQGWMTTREYMDHYYGDEYRHGLEKNPEFVTLARSIDGNPHPEGFSPLDAAPVTWVGDQNHLWTAKEEGIEEALNYILTAAKVGYAVIGSDVAGYHGPTPIPANLYVRWAQFSSFCGLFLNGGHGDRMVWHYPAEIFEPIRRAAWLHNELVPYVYTYVVDCHNDGRPLMRPLGKIGRSSVTDGDYRYLYGEDFLVAPIHEDRAAWEVKIPEGDWRYFFDDAELIHGPTTIARDFALDAFPVYVREGAIIPMNVTRPYTGLGDKDSDGFITWNIYPGAAAGKFTLHNTDKSGDTTVAVEPGAAGLAISVSGVHHPHILRVRMDAKPSGVTLDASPLAEGTEWKYDAASHRLWIRTSDYKTGAYLITTK